MSYEAPLSEVIDPYVEQRIAAAPVLARLVGQLEENASPASADVDPDTMTFVPVAAQREGGEQTSHMLGQYYAQDLDGLELVLSVNRPIELDAAGERRAAGTLEAVRDFQSDHPDMPLTFFRRFYHEGTPIGRTRGELVDAGLGYRRDTRHRDILALIQDADPVEIPPTHLREMRETFDGSDVVKVVRGLAVYERTGHENFDALLGWYEWPLLTLGVSLSEANAGLSVRDVYIPANGYDPHIDDSETVTLIKQTPGFRMGSGMIQTMRGESKLVTSSRRLISAAYDPNNPQPPWDLDYATTSSMHAYHSEAPLPHDIDAGLARTWVEDFLYGENGLFLNSPRILYPRAGGGTEGEAAALGLVEMAKRARESFGGPEIDEQRAESLIRRTIAAIKEQEAASS